MHFIIQRIFPLKILATSALQSNCVNVILFQVIVLLSTKNVRNTGFSLSTLTPQKHTAPRSTENCEHFKVFHENS